MEKGKCNAYNLVGKEGEQSELIKESQEIHDRLMTLLNSGTSIKIPDRYVADLIEVINNNYLYILNK